jgi:hypothetical protein
MKKYKDLSVKVKIPIMMGIASFAVFTLICVLLVMSLRSFSLKDSSQIARLSAIEAGGRLSEQINASAGILPARASVISSLIETNYVPIENKRKMMLDDMKALINSENTLIKNAWLILEPNIVDGMDSLFIDNLGANSMGNVSAR